MFPYEKSKLIISIVPDLFELTKCFHITIKIVRDSYLSLDDVPSFYLDDRERTVPQCSANHNVMCPYDCFDHLGRSVRSWTIIWTASLTKPHAHASSR